MSGSSKRRHHEQSKFCYKRPAYREAKWERAVKVYTVSQESKYLLVQGVPSLGVAKELVELFAIYGAVEEYRFLDEYPGEEFTDVYWIKFKKIQSARFAKKKLDMRSFFGGALHVCYAPEFETVNDTREKLMERKLQVERKCKEYYPEKYRSRTPNDKHTMEVVNETLKRSSQSRELHCDSLSQVPAGETPSHIWPSPADQNALKEPSPYPELPLPPLHLPPFMYPPPPPPPPPELPRLSTKNASLPADVQANEMPLVKCRSTSLAVKEECHNNSSGTSYRNRSASEKNTEEPKKTKRIVWHTAPSVRKSYPPVDRRNLPDPGAWDPHALERKQMKSLTGDRNLDEVAQQIRDRLTKVTSTNNTQDGSAPMLNLEPQVEPVKKKARKRI